jgi:hypothetical protein
LLWQELTDSATGTNTFWLDQVSYDASSWLELTGITNGQCQITLHVGVGTQYEVLVSTNLTSWTPLDVFTATNTTMQLIDTNVVSGSRFYRLKEVPTTSFWLETPKWLASIVQLVLHGPAGRRFQVQASTNLSKWSGLAFVTNTSGTASYRDTLASNWPARYYRAALLP